MAVLVLMAIPHSLTHAMPNPQSACTLVSKGRNL